MLCQDCDYLNKFKNSDTCGLGCCNKDSTWRIVNLKDKCSCLSDENENDTNQNSTGQEEEYDIKLIKDFEVVPVVKCINCIYWNSDDNSLTSNFGRCTDLNVITHENWFCADGEVKK